jgi:hypothetical protein
MKTIVFSICKHNNFRADGTDEFAILLQFGKNGELQISNALVLSKAYRVPKGIIELLHCDYLHRTFLFFFHKMFSTTSEEI